MELSALLKHWYERQNLSNLSTVFRFKGFKNLSDGTIMRVSESNSRSSSRFPLAQRKKHTDEKGKMKEKDDGEGSDSDGTGLSSGGSVPPIACWGPPRRKPIVGHPVGSSKVSTLTVKG